MSEEPNIIEPVPAPEVFVDGYQTSSVLNGVAKFTFFTMAHDPVTGVMQRRIVLRLTAPLNVAAGIHEAMGQMLERVEMVTPPTVEQSGHA